MTVITWELVQNIFMVLRRAWLIPIWNEDDVRGLGTHGWRPLTHYS